MKNALYSLFGIYVLLLIAVFLVLGIGRVSGPELSVTKSEVQRQRILKESFVYEEEEGEINLAILKKAEQELVIKDIQVGAGAEAERGDTVSVHYTGKFEDGEVFDSSRQPGRDPFQFELGAGHVIGGWEEGVVGMKVGGSRRLVVPPQLAYGFEDYGPIPGGSTLVFEIELLSIFDR